MERPELDTSFSYVLYSYVVVAVGLLQTRILVMCFSIIMGEGTALECKLVPNAPSCCLKYSLMHLMCEGELKIHSHLSLVRERMVLFLRYCTQGF